MQLERAGIQTSDLPIIRRPALPPELPICQLLTQNTFSYLSVINLFNKSVTSTDRGWTDRLSEQKQMVLVDPIYYVKSSEFHIFLFMYV